ncbi:rhodanese-like domain-containing protein [Candidatus Magnetominusculus xianensis]|uniref:Rhodanese-like domain-containing protein n=1 Tax=Candidatus Magnetominusculus xianensis TaxID=1748249 RepID=A0ABR5SKJ5_9BACT|nr:rhodanese-like domain-containing protein [Candidatus Magnetominusculus xianensis]KWT94497.1 rhodanese-like domain-containing protein [Candidatus Magnetominusculus xianensis]MBF0405109.1 rhodanese-like domain-containing protein [Nitrospirota bacterium]
MRLKKMIAAAWVVVIVFASVPMAAEEPKPDPNRAWPVQVDEHVAKVKKEIKLIDMEAFKKIADNKGDAIIIDAREPEEFTSGRVPGAVNIPRGLAEFKIWKALAGFPDKTNTALKIYVYCKIGGRAVLTTKALQDVGFTNVTAVDMKLADWVKANYPIER